MLLFLHRRLVVNLLLKLPYQLLYIIHIVGIDELALLGLYVAIVEIFQCMLQAIDIAILGPHHRYVQIGTAQITFTLNGFVRWLLRFLRLLSLLRLHFLSGGHTSGLWREY